ncbi:21687_t:CDS:2, partial [Dentiscutata erythropus]
KSGDLGQNIIVEIFGMKIVVQCKAWYLKDISCDKVDEFRTVVRDGKYAFGVLVGALEENFAIGAYKSAKKSEGDDEIIIIVYNRMCQDIKCIGGNFDKWARRKEYRGYIHIPSFNVKCDTKGYLVTANPRDPDYCNKENLTKNPEQCDDAECNPYGYTKEYVLHVYYSSADVYTNDLLFNKIQWSKIKDNTCLSIFDARASRVYMTVCCNHQVSVTVHRTIFPQTSLYINGKRVSKQA